MKEFDFNEDVEVNLSDNQLNNEDIHIGLTGHRPKDLWSRDLSDERWLDVKDLLKSFIEDAITRYNLVYCHSGMAEGADTIWAMAITEMKEINERVIFVAEVPHAAQASKWDSVSKDRYYDLLKLSDETNLYSDEYVPWCMETRNRGMVDNSNIMLALWDGRQPKKGSGTFNAVRYTLKTNKRLIQIHPNYINEYKLIKDLSDVII